jgi:GntR family transcriptional regulator
MGPRGSFVAGSGAKQVAYSEIALEIRNDLHRGKYAPGKRMPTLVDLAAKYGVSHSTVRLAFKKLAADGLLEVHQGRGTFVVFECISVSEVGTGSLPAATIPLEMLWSLRNQTRRRLPDESILLCRVGCPQEND